MGGRNSAFKTHGSAPLSEAKKFAELTGMHNNLEAF
jgi:hypothetical protein